MAANVVSRRRFLAIGALGAGAFVRASRASAPADEWRIVRDLIAAGAIGRVRNAGVLLPETRVTPNSDWVSPARQANDTLAKLRVALNLGSPLSTTTAEHASTNSYAMTCKFADGPSISIASVSGLTALQCTIRGERGVMHVHAGSVSLEVDGQWRTFES